MSVEDRIPSFTEKELENLRDNATRLAQNGAQKQKDDATRLLPIIEAALVERRATRVAETSEKKRVRQADMATARAKKAAARKAAAAEAAS